jgi:hypothetical protein
MKKFLLIIFILSLISIAVGVFLWLNNPVRMLSENEKEAAIANILGRKPNLTNNTPIGNTQYKDDYLSFNYPKKARIYSYKEPNTANDASYLDLFSFDILDPRLVFNFSVKQSINKTLNYSDIADVKLRQLSDRGYAQKELQSDGQQGLAFERLGEKAEETGFFIVNNRIFSFSVTGSDPKEVTQLFDSITQSIIFTR